MTFTAKELREEAERELKMRRRVYADRVGRGSMTQRDMDRKIALQEAIVARLQQDEEGERLI